MRKNLTSFDVVNLTLLLLITLVCLYPFVNILAISLSSGQSVMAGEVFVYPIGFTLEAYKYILTTPNLGVLRGLWNSSLYTVLGTIFAVAMTFITAYCLSRKRFIGRHGFMLLIFFTMIFDGGLIPNYLLIKTLGMVDSIWVMIIPGAISVWLLIIARSFLDTQPVELEEAAFIDGANDWQTMYRIFLPLSLPILATISVFYAVGIWNAYLGPLIYLQDKHLHPIQVILYQLVLDSKSGNGGGLSLVESEDGILFPRNLQAAVIFCGMFPILLVYPFAQRYFTKGLLVGSIKG